MIQPAPEPMKVNAIYTRIKIKSAKHMNKLIYYSLLIWKDVLTPGNTEDLYIARSIFSNCDRRTRFVPTRIRNSILSRSFFSRSLLWPWCCIRTQSLFISAKFRSIKSIESSTYNEVNSKYWYSVWVRYGERLYYGCLNRK